MKKLAKNNNICEATLGLEKTLPGKPCFGYQLKTCAGACIGLEKKELHNLKVTTALKQIELSIWPFEGAIAIREGDSHHLFHKWSYLGMAKDQESVHELLDNSTPEFDLDTYKIIRGYLRKISKKNILIFKTSNEPPAPSYQS